MSRHRDFANLDLDSYLDDEEDDYEDEGYYDEYGNFIYYEDEDYAYDLQHNNYSIDESIPNDYLDISITHVDENKSQKKKRKRRIIIIILINCIIKNHILLVI